MQPFSFANMATLIVLLAAVMIIAFLIINFVSKIAEFFSTEKKNQKLRNINRLIDQNAHLHGRLCEAERSIKSMRQEMVQLKNRVHSENRKG